MSIIRFYNSTRVCGIFRCLNLRNRLSVIFGSLTIVVNLFLIKFRNCPTWIRKHHIFSVVQSFFITNRDLTFTTSVYKCLKAVSVGSNNFGCWLLTKVKQKCIFYYEVFKISLLIRPVYLRLISCFIIFFFTPLLFWTR